MEAGGGMGQSFERFGPYVLLRCSGAGGFGRVDLAVKGPSELAKVCVVKRMHDAERSPEIGARFRREAHIALRLTHGAIAQTVGVEEINGELCLLQEYVDGANLAQLVRRATPERLPVPVALHVVREVGRALAYAHGLGIVHRDVTLDNVMLSWTGEVKLIDFGIARANDDAMLTTAGVVVGRKTYTAPEVWSGARADARSDIYSVGIVLRQLVTGEDLDAAASADGSLPDLRTLRVEIADDVAGVITRALAAEPAQRWQSARELVEALGRLLPHGFEGETAVASFLGRHFDVRKERQILEEDLAAARQMLERGNSEGVTGSAPRRKRVIVFGAAVATAAVVAIVGAVALGRGRPRGPSVAEPARPRAAAILEPVPPAQTPQRAIVQPGAREEREPAKVEEVAPLPTGGPPRRAPAPGRTAQERRAPTSASAPVRPSADAADVLRNARESWDVGDIGGALLLAREAAAKGAGPEAHILVGTLLLKRGERAEAQRELDGVLRQDPGNQKAARLLELARRPEGQ